MFRTKILITVTYLIVVTIIHHGLANKPRHQLVCEDLMSERWFQGQTLMPEFWFGSNAKANFANAFNHLTNELLFTCFEERINHVAQHDPDQRPLFFAQATIVKAYFIRLSNHGLTLPNYLDTMSVWCKDRVAHVVAKKTKIFGKDTVEDCRKAIKKKFEIDENDKRGVQFQKFFEEFTLNNLKNLKNKGESSSSHVNTQDTVVQINNYPFFYFKYYGDTILQHGNFQNVEQYCGSLPPEIIHMLNNLP